MTIRLQNRDKEIIEFVKCTPCTTQIITEHFFNGSMRACQKRLSLLTDYHYLNRWRNDINEQFIYYVGNRPRNLSHAITVSNFISKLLQMEEIELLKWVLEPTFKDTRGKIVRPDIFIAFRNKLTNEVKLAFVEVCLKNKFNSDKYNSFYYSRQWKNNYKLPYFPSFIIVGNRTFEIDNKYNYITVDKELFYIEKILNL